MLDAVHPAELFEDVRAERWLRHRDRELGGLSHVLDVDLGYDLLPRVLKPLGQQQVAAFAAQLLTTAWRRAS